jgi:hypothetical protein
MPSSGVTSAFNANKGNPVKNYGTLDQGLDATAKTLRLSRYEPILKAIMAGDGSKALVPGNFENFKTWGTDPTVILAGLKTTTKTKTIPVSEDPYASDKGGKAAPAPGADSGGAQYIHHYEGEGGSVADVPLVDGIVTADQYSKASQSTIIKEGLDVKPWWSEVQSGDTVVGNKSLLGRTPVWFKVLMTPGGSLLTDGTNPVELRLNCSLAQIDLQMKHKYSRVPTRTGMHISFWGMEADTIHASGSTGAWMNQYGLTSFMSTMKSKTPREMQDYIKQMNPGEGERTNWLASLGVPTADGSSRPPTVGQQVQPYKVSAQDAFAELLALFKYNAITRFRTDNYDGYFSDRDQLGGSLWSEKYGGSTTQAGARNNDVMYRGYVIMGVRDDTYVGFFKSLTFNEDAEKPNRWHFDYTFQVQYKVRMSTKPQA